MARSEDTPPVEPTGATPEPSLDNDGFLSRWSRRKQAAREQRSEGDNPTTTAPPQHPEQVDSAAVAYRELTDEDMPPVESLNEQSDYSAFLSPKVSEELRQAALRKLFKLPEFNVRDGLDDYDEDYTTFTELGAVVTHDMRRMLEREKERMLAANAEPEPAAVPASQREPGAEFAQNQPNHADSPPVSETDAEPMATPDNPGSRSA